MSGSSSSFIVSPPLIEHDVFLNFRGEDTRDNFVSHLYAELQRKKIETFIDYKLDRGKEISPVLHKAIEESKIYVLVFSKDYASSTWCLDELTKILECKKRYGRDVIPVFYKVDPSNVRNQRERYAEAFVKHEQRFRDNMDKVHAWKAALTEAAGISGWDSRVTRPEYTLVEKIVKDILTKFNRFSMSDHQGIIGIEYHIARIQSTLHLESLTNRIIGIWGMGGIGKTTIAKQIYHKLALQFGSSSLVLNVEEEIQRHGIHHIGTRCLSELIKEASSGSKRTKVLLILDDVNNWDPLKEIIERFLNFGQGNRIVVTSRDMQVLKNAGADEIYEVKEMNFQDSLKLFSLNAFKQNLPIKPYMDLSVKVLNYAKGIPLALKVLGSLLYGRTREAWESELQKLEKLPHLEIFKALKLSYDGLDEEQKDIFLDIACFYQGHEEIIVAETLDSCGFSAKIGMDVLKDRCLISVLEGRIVMHDLVQEMGQEIVRQQCVYNPGKRSRLWKVEEIYRVLRKNKGTDAVQCILLDICKIKEVELDAKTFEKMDNMRMLQFFKPRGYWNDSNVFLPSSSLESLPDSLKILHWDDFPQRSLPPNFCPENLVRLEMLRCHLEQLWEGDQHLPNLKRLDLSYSRKLIRIPDLCLSPNIEEIILSDCVSLIQVHSSRFLKRLKCLCLNGCVELSLLTIPSNILLTSSGLILLSNCCKLETFSMEIIRNDSTFKMLSLQALACSSLSSERLLTSQIFSNAFGRYQEEEEEDDTANNLDLLYAKVLREGVSSIFSTLNKLCWLDLSNCESLTSLPIDLSMLTFLKRLHLRGCSKLENFPEIMGRMENLVVLVLDRTAIRELPSSLCHLVQLEELSLHECTSLEIIPSCIGSLSKLCNLGLTYCESLETFPSSIFKLKLTKLDLHGCSMLTTFPDILEPTANFAHINMTKTAIRELPSSFNNLVGLRTLRLNMCTDLELLPNSIVNLNPLSELDFSGCAKLTEIPEIIANLSSLKLLDLSDCKKLECIPQLPPFLKQLLAFDCPSIRTVMPNSRIQIPSDSTEGIFKFHLTNSQQLDPSAYVNIVDDAWLRITADAFRSVFFYFPGSAIPHWFPSRGKGHSVTINTDSLNLCNDNRLIGFALSVVFELLDTNDVEGGYGFFSYILKFGSDDGMHIINYHDELRSFYWKGRERIADQDHTLLWKYNLESPSKSLMLCHVHSFTFEITNYDYGLRRRRYFKSIATLKECGICPLYTK